MASDIHSTESITEPVSVDGQSHLNDIVDAHEVVLVDFYADWCGPCKMIEPVLEQLATETAAVIAKVDVDQHQELAGSFGVRGVPTLLMYAQGEPVEQHVGVLPEEQLRTLIDRHAA